MNTPKLIVKQIDDIEAAEADIRSGDPALAAHGFKNMIALLTEQLSHLHAEQYPEDRRVAEFINKRIGEAEAARAKMLALAEQEREAKERREKLHAEWRRKDAERQAREKALRIDNRLLQKALDADRAFHNARQLAEVNAKLAAEDARQGSLFGDAAGLPEIVREGE